MKIGIDGGSLSVGDDRLKVGTYRVAYNLVKELPRMDVKNFYRIYSFGRGEEGNTDFTRRNVSFIRLPRPGFAKFWQPLELMCNPVDAYIGISQSLPYTLYDIKKIGFIHDIGFLHHPEYYRESYFALSWQTKDIVRYATHIITNSYATMQSVHDTYNVPKTKMTVAYLGVEDVFRPTGRRLTRDTPFFLFVGSLKPGKNVPFMLRAFAEFLKKSQKVYDFLLVGSDYWLDPGVPATISSLGLRDRVHMMGFVDDKALATYYRGASAFVSVSRIEGFGFPVVEAMASGCPVIGSTVGSFPEVVKNAGLLVDPTSEQALVDAMSEIVTNEKTREKCSRFGISRSRRFRWDTFAKTISNVLMHVSHPA